MKISPISSHRQSFGIIKKSAIEKAVSLAQDDYELRNINNLVQSQQNNPYSIVGLSDERLYNFAVYKPGAEFAYGFNKLSECCKIANFLARKREFGEEPGTRFYYVYEYCVYLQEQEMENRIQQIKARKMS